MFASKDLCPLRSARSMSWPVHASRYPASVWWLPRTGGSTTIKLRFAVVPAHTAQIGRGEQSFSADKDTE
jgi:hypothetical protein